VDYNINRSFPFLPYARTNNFMIEENILNQIAETNQCLEDIQALSRVHIDKIDKLANVLKGKGLKLDLKELSKLLNEPVKVNVKLDIK